MAAAQPSFDRLDAAVDLAIADLDEDGLAAPARRSTAAATRTGAVRPM